MRFEYKKNERIQIRILGAIVTFLFWLKHFTYWCKNINYPKQQCLFALWHAHQCALYSIKDRKKTNVMISRSKDGEIIARATEAMGIKTVRGSITRGGASATKELIDRIKKGEFGAITVDGPKGPKRVVKKGIVEIAKITGIPIVPMSWYCPSIGFLKFKTWDEFRFPLFGKLLISYYGEPIFVKPDADDNEIEKIRKQIEDTLNSQYEILKRDFKKFEKLKQ